MIEITNDLYDIALRLRSVNDSYRVYYNVAKSRYEVWNADANRLEFILPYDELDARAVEYARYTSVQNAAALIEEIERNNEQVERNQLAQAKENVLRYIEEGDGK